MLEHWAQSNHGRRSKAGYPVPGLVRSLLDFAAGIFAANYHGIGVEREKSKTIDLSVC